MGSVTLSKKIVDLKFLLVCPRDSACCVDVGI